jgi:hypothetical protein
MSCRPVLLVGFPVRFGLSGRARPGSSCHDFSVSRLQSSFARSCWPPVIVVYSVFAPRDLFPAYRTDPSASVSGFSHSDFHLCALGSSGQVLVLQFSCRPVFQLSCVFFCGCRPLSAPRLLELLSAFVQFCFILRRIPALRLCLNCSDRESCCRWSERSSRHHSRFGCTFKFLRSACSQWPSVLVSEGVARLWF